MVNHYNGSFVVYIHTCVFIIIITWCLVVELYYLVHTYIILLCSSITDVPIVTPGFAVLFPGNKVLFTCNIESGVLWAINGTVLSSDDFPPGVYTFNASTLVVNMSTNSTTYACAVLGQNSRIIVSNAATLILGGQYVCIYSICVYICIC